MSKHSILLLKATSPPTVKDVNPADEEYEKILTELGCTVFFIPILQFDFVNIQTLIQKLSQPDRFSGIILTSPRSVEACQKAFSTFENENLLNVWRETKSCYTVGPATSRKAGQSLLWSPSQIRGGDQSGNSQSLAQYILNEYKQVDRNTTTEIILLYPCGNLKRDTLSKELSHSLIKINLDTVTCYNTNPHTQLEKSLKSLSESLDSLDMVVFFSPSGVRFCWHFLQKYYKMLPKCIAIGPTTMETLRSYCNEGQIMYEATTPSAFGIKDIVSQIIKEL